MAAMFDLMRSAREAETVVPGFNIPYLPMMEPVVRALREANSFGLVMVARLEWEKFEAGSPRAVREEYARVGDERCTRLHLDHVPVVDEDGQRVDYESILREALDLGYDSVMVDGSRLPLEENIRATRRIVEMARAAGVPVEGELGAVLGHEEGPLPSYEEIFASGRGFTDPEEARRFVEETGVAWLSVAVGSIHGAISAARKDEEKVRARLDLERVTRIRRATGVPLVLHGGSGIDRECLREGVRRGIAKINIGTAIRQAYERARESSVEAGQEAVYRETLRILREELAVAGTAKLLGTGA